MFDIPAYILVFQNAVKVELAPTEFTLHQPIVARTTTSAGQISIEFIFGIEFVRGVG